MWIRSLAPLVLLVASSWCNAAGAQSVATAETLFREGKALMAEGKYAYACPKFAASQRLDAGLGTLLNLADCHEKLGRTASAWGEFLEAAYQARTTGAKEHERVARERASQLEPRLVHLTINVPALVPDQVVQRDGQRVDPATFGVQTPVDPGELEISSTAPGYQPFSQRIEVGDQRKSAIVAIPALQPEDPSHATSSELSQPAVAPPPPDSAPSHQVTPPPDPASSTSAPSSSGWTGLHTAGVVTGGIGVLGLGAAGILTLTASSSWDDANCPNNLCNTTADQDAAERAKQQADIATACLITGGIAAAAGVAILVYAASSENELASARVDLTPVAMPNGGALSVQGRF